MKKLIVLLMALTFLTSCDLGGLFSASVVDPFSEGQEDVTMITLANGTRINVGNDIDKLLNSEAIDFDGYTLEAKLIVKDINTGSIQLIDFPKVERTNAPVTTDIFEIPEILYEKDLDTNLIWEKDATKSGLMTYSEAKKYCTEFGLRAYGEPFSIPSPEEIKTILENTTSGINTEKYPNLNGTYWTTHEFAYSFYDKTGILVDKDKGLAYIRCVGNIKEDVINTNKETSNSEEASLDNMNEENLDNTYEESLNEDSTNIIEEEVNPENNIDNNNERRTNDIERTNVVRERENLDEENKDEEIL